MNHDFYEEDGRIFGDVIIGFIILVMLYIGAYALLTM